MSEQQWTRVAAVTDCVPGRGMEVVARGRIVALFNVDGAFHALDGICPHQGGPLGKGVLAGCVVTCPWHGWQFDVQNGQHQINPTLRHESFDVRIEDGEVFVALPD